MALERASDTERTAEIRRQASRIPQRCEGAFVSFAERGFYVVPDAGFSGIVVGQ